MKSTIVFIRVLRNLYLVGQMRWIVLIAIIILAAGCQKDPKLNCNYYYQITGADVYVTDTMRNKVYFNIDTEDVIVKKREVEPDGSCDECCGGIPDVDTDESKTEIRFNKPILYAGDDTIPAFDNVLSYRSMLTFQSGMRLNGVGATSFNFDRIYSKYPGFKFPAGDYTVHFKWVLNDSTEFTDQVDVYIDLQ